MAEYTKNAEAATAYSFDGTKAAADILVALDIGISIQDETDEEAVILTVLDEDGEDRTCLIDQTILYRGDLYTPTSVVVMDTTLFGTYWTIAGS